MNAKKEQVYLSSEAHQLSYNINKQPFNVIAHKRIKKSKPSSTEPSLTIQSSKNHKTLQQQLSHFIGEIKQQSVEDVHQTLPNDQPQSEARKKFHSNDGKRQRSKKNMFKKLNETFNIRSLPKQIKQDKEGQRNALVLNNGKKSVTQSGQTRVKVQQSHKVNKINQLLKQDLYKKTINQHHLMNWLNQLLHQFTKDRGIENQGHFQALVHFGLDSNTLISRGVSPSNIFRIYQALFVHSLGFNEVLKQTAKNQKTVLKSIWKAYMMLLEYCSEGNFQTIIGELQRDMIKKQELLVKQIQTRQEQINNNEEEMQRRLFKYVKENKELSNKVKELKQTKKIIQQELKQLQIAYNDQVSLRLNYEYKINQVYSVHEGLSLIYTGLKEDFNKLQNQHQKIQKDEWKTKQKYIEVHAENAFISDHLKETKTLLKASKQFIEALRMNQAQLSGKLARELKNKGQEVQQLKEKDKRIAQLLQEIKNCNLMIEMMKYSADSQMESYKKLTLQNSDFRRISDEQALKIAQLLRDNKYLNSKESNLISDINFFQTKISKLEDTIRGYVQSTYDLNKKIHKLQIEYQNKCMQVQQLQKTAIFNQKTTSNIKMLYEQMESQKLRLDKYAKEMNEKYTDIHVLNLDLDQKLSNAKREIFQKELQLSKMYSQIREVKKKQDFEKEDDMIKYNKLHKIWNGANEQKQSSIAQFAKLKVELQKAQARINNLTELYSDEVFEKAKLQSNYKDYLILHEVQRQAQKEMYKDKSKMVQELDNAQVQLEISKKLHIQEVLKLQKKTSQLQARINVLQNVMRKKQVFIHPMRYEDAIELLRRQAEAHKNTKNTAQSRLEQWQQKKEEMNIVLRIKQTEFRNEIQLLHLKMNKMQFAMQNERKFYKIQRQNQAFIIFNLEINLTNKTIEAQANSKNLLNDKINERNKKVQELLAQIDRMADFYQKKTYQNEIYTNGLIQQKQSLEQKLIQFKKDSEQKLSTLQKKTLEKHFERKKKRNEMALKVAVYTYSYNVSSQYAEYRKQKGISKHHHTNISSNDHAESIKNKQDPTLQYQLKLSYEKRQNFKKKLKLATAYYHQN